MKVRTLNHDALWHGMAVKFRKYSMQVPFGIELREYCMDSLFYHLHFRLYSQMCTTVGNQVEFELKNTEIHEKE